MKRILVLSLIAIMIVTIVGCGRKVTEVPQGEDGNDVVVDPNPAGEMVEVVLHFMNPEYVNTGNEELEKFIVVKRDVLVGEHSIEEIIIKELQNPTDEVYTALKNINVLSVETAGNTAYVNLSSERLYGGSLDEMGILTQVILSLTELEEIDAVQFLVDGSKRETLMGHFLIDEPLTRDDVLH